MRNPRLIPIAICLVAVFNSCKSQPAVDLGHYSVDPAVKSLIDKKLTTENEEINVAVDFKIWEDGKMIADSYASGKTFRNSRCMAAVHNGTIIMSSLIGMFSGFGFELALSKDSCRVSYLVTSDMKMYKLKQTDSLTFGLQVPCESYKLAFIKQPAFKKDEILEGIIDFTSKEYYEIRNGKEKKFKVQMTGYFITEPLQELTEKFRPPEPVVIETPKSVTTTQVIDSSYFWIKVYKGRFEMELFKKTQTVKTLAEVDRYIKANKSRIDPGKIILKGDANLNYQEMKPVFEVLKKYGYHKFKMMTENPGLPE